MSHASANSANSAESTQKITIENGLDHLDAVRALIVEYTKRLNRDLGFQDLDAELADLPHKYAGAHGRMLIALVNGEAAGCVAYHRLDDAESLAHGRAEMKRLYVRPQFRGLHLGHRLAAAIIEQARADGYQQMVLDTITPLKTAIHTYTSLGFTPIEAYYHNPMKDVIYLGLNL
jgi:GNAT superfamily N-acetyltransferase